MPSRQSCWQLPAPGGFRLIAILALTVSAVTLRPSARPPARPPAYQYKIEAINNWREEIPQAAAFLCGVFLEEGIINQEPRGNINKHIDLTKKEFIKQYETAMMPDNNKFNVKLIKATKSLEGDQEGEEEWVGLGQVMTDNASPRRALIHNLCVSRRHRRKGVATSLVEACIETIRDEWQLKEVLLNVEDDNDAAMRFYNRLGFMFEEEESGFGSFMMRKAL